MKVVLLGMAFAATQAIAGYGTYGIAHFAHAPLFPILCTAFRAAFNAAQGQLVGWLFGPQFLADLHQDLAEAVLP
jgi:hypothetical protein